MSAIHCGLLALPLLLAACAPRPPATAAPVPAAPALAAALDQNAPLWLAGQHVPSVSIA